MPVRCVVSWSKRARRPFVAVTIVAISAISSARANPPVGTYVCSVGNAFYLTIAGEGRCWTRELALAEGERPCTYSIERSGDLALTGAAIPMLNRYLLRFVPAGSTGSSADMQGPGLEAIEEVLLSDDPPRSRGWCSRQ